MPVPSQIVVQCERDAPPMGSAWLRRSRDWIPASAGMTVGRCRCHPRSSSNASGTPRQWAALGYGGRGTGYRLPRTCSELMRPWPGRAGGGGIPLIPAFPRQGRRCKRPVAAQGESYQLTEPEQLPVRVTVQTWCDMDSSALRHGESPHLNLPPRGEEAEPPPSTLNSYPSAGMTEVENPLC